MLSPAIGLDHREGAVTNFEQDDTQSQPHQGGYQPWAGDTTPGYPAPQYDNTVAPYPPQYGQQYPAQQYGQQYPQQQYGQQYPQSYQPYQGGQYPYQQQPSNPMGTAGFVCGLLGLVLFWIPFVGLVLAVIGIALSGAGMSSGKRAGASTGLAVAGLVLGIVALLPGLFWILFAASV
jgi:hypothetical protein